MEVPYSPPPAAAAQSSSRARDLAEAIAPARVGEGEITQLERTIERARREAFVSTAPAAPPLGNGWLAAAGH